ncbi:DUF4147 domain-containing protein, partial [Candidatus Bipolaricaulota bacterium]
MIHIDRDRLRERPLRDDHLRILEAALAAVDPAALIRERLLVDENALVIDDLRFPIKNRGVWILSIGKAAVPMAQAAESLLGSARIAGGVALTRRGY